VVQLLKRSLQIEGNTVKVQAVSEVTFPPMIELGAAFGAYDFVSMDLKKNSHHQGA
jgi:hypothetical protein